MVLKGSNNKKQPDRIYSSPLRHIEDFRFDRNVAAVFEDMIRRSAPGYESIIPMMGMLARHYVQPGTLCYDLGSSLGATAISMAGGIGKTDSCRILAIDNSPDMIMESRSLLTGLKACSVSLICADIRSIRFVRASLIALNFTLQFVPKQDRVELLRRIYGGLVPGGALVLSEKIVFEDNKEQDWQTEHHLAFKKYQGYSDLEISQKRSALENIMKPESINEHIERLEKIGFRTVYRWFQCFNFISIIAVK